MFPLKTKVIVNADSKTYPLGQIIARPEDETTSALVALSHTPLERQLYEAMLLINVREKSEESFTVRRVKEVTDIPSLSTIRRGLEGLAAKLSIERDIKDPLDTEREPVVAYRVFSPEKVLERRNERGLRTFEKGIDANGDNRSFKRVVRLVVENHNLSRREAQVTLGCVEGLTNAEIGSRLQVTEQTVKFHLRNIFVKFGVKRRTELISQLLR
jgi:DNA-binding CsgD family transcriptional regulator